MCRNAVNRPLFFLPRMLWLCGGFIGFLGSLQTCGGGEPMRVCVPAGQSNMEGQAVSDVTGKDYNENRGTLVECMANPGCGVRFAKLREGDGRWRFRDDVWFSYQRENQDHPRTRRAIEGWEVLVDDRLANEEHRELGVRAVRFLESKLFEIAVVMPAERLAELRKVRIVLDLECGGLQSMQYHPSL